MTPPLDTATGEPVPSDERLRTWIRAHPETWDAPAANAAALDAVIVRRVVGEEVRARLAAERRRTRVGVAVAVALLSAGTAAGVAAWVRSGQPSVPHTGTACRLSASIDADAIVVPPSADPVAACADAWASGRLGPVPDGAPRDESGAPALAACIGTGGAVEVIPGDPSTCARLGLEPAATALDDEARAVITLQDRIAEEVNLSCVAGSDIRAVLDRMLSDAGLRGWTTRFIDDGATATCVQVAIDAAVRVLIVDSGPAT